VSKSKYAKLPRGRDGFVLNKSDIARLAERSRQWIDLLDSQGKLPKCVVVRGRKYFCECDVKKWLGERLVKREAFDAKMRKRYGGVIGGPDREVAAMLKTARTALAEAQALHSEALKALEAAAARQLSPEVA
jgi:hypothetical protein